MSQLPSPKFYSSEEVQQILNLAIVRSSVQPELSRDQLLEIAMDLGMGIDVVQKAEQDWLNLQLVHQKKQDFNLYRRTKLKNRAVRYLIINMFLLSANLMSAGYLAWLFYLSLFWGLTIALEFWKTLQTKGEDYERDFLHWKLKKQMKQSLFSIWNKINFIQ